MGCSLRQSEFIYIKGLLMSSPTDEVWSYYLLVTDWPPLSCLSICLSLSMCLLSERVKMKEEKHLNTKYPSKFLVCLKQDHHDASKAELYWMKGVS